MPWGSERWLVSDMPGAESLVSGGALAGTSLRALMETRAGELLGPVPPAEGGRFPLLFKLIEARERLSVQVHPDGPAALRLGRGARPKAEGWHLLGAAPGAELVLGLAPGVDRTELEAALRRGALEPLLGRSPARAGDFVYLPAGLLHALGGGISLLELQQASDTTYRVHDWNRPGLDGRPRALHLEEALEAIDFGLRGPAPFAAPTSGRPGLRCPWFELERIEFRAGEGLALEAGLPRVLACLEGALALEGGPCLGPGEVALVPAAAAARISAAGRAVGLLGTALIPGEGARR